jgi:outer membrane autotransporter protein
MSGNGSLLKTGTGTVTLSGNNTHTGATNINAGKLDVNGTLTSSATSVNSGGTLGGTGALGNVTINSGGTIAPGTLAVGNLTVGNLVLNGGGNYNWQTASVNGTGTAGTNWDLITSNGSLSINASANSTVGIRVSSLVGNITNNIKKAQWQIGEFIGGITGYNKSFFSVNASETGARGRFFVTTDNSSLMLNYKTAAVWLGGTGNWTSTNMWEDAYPPENGDAVEFSGAGGTSTNNSSLTSIAGITFTSIATGAYTLNGKALATGEEGIVNDSAFAHTIALNLTGGEILGISTATNNLTLAGVVSGNSTLAKSGNSTLTLSGNNTYTGGTTISAGTLALGGTAGAITGNISVGSGATFAVNRTNNATISNLIRGNGSFAHIGSGVTSMVANNTYSGGSTIQSGMLWVKAPQALGTGNVALNGGTLVISSQQEMGGNLQVGGNFTWTDGTIAYYDTGKSPESGDLTIGVAGTFAATSGNKTFDFSQVEALDYGTYTLVNATTVSAGGVTFLATHGPNTKLFGNFTTTNQTLIYTVTGAMSGGRDIQNNGGPNTPVVAYYEVSEPTITVNQNNWVNTLNFTNSAPLAIQADGQLTVTSGILAVQTGSSVVSGGLLNTPGNLDKMGSGMLDLQSNANVNGIANVLDGMLSVNGQLNANSVMVDPTATLGGAGVIVAQNVVVNGNLSPGNSPGTLNVVGNLVLGAGSSTVIEIESPTNFDRIVVSGTATLGGTLSAVNYGGGTISSGDRYDILQAGSIVGEYSTLVAPDGLRIRFLNSGTVGTLLFGPSSYVPMAINPNQVSVAKALDTFIVATDGDRLAVSIALDSLTTEQFPSAFDQIMPGFYESLADIAIEQAFAQTQMLNQRISSVRLGAAGFQAIGGISQPLVHDKNGKSAAEAKDASPIVESATATNWNAWALGTGMFSRSTNLGSLQNYNNDAGGFLVGADYRWSENFVTGLYGGYDYSYAEYNGGGSTKGNSVSFGTYASYAKDGYYADAVIGGGYTGFQTQRAIEFSTIDRTASADPNSGQFTAGINLGKDFEVGKFTLGPIVGAQYTYAGIGSFTESGAESLDLSLGQQNANSLRSTLGGRIAYTWNLNQKIALIPEVRMFWQHEFLNNARNINASLDGGNGASFDYETTDPYRNSVFAGAGVTAQFGKNLSGSVFYNINFGSQTYQSNMISAGLNFSF